MQPWANSKSHLGTSVALKFSDGSSYCPMNSVFASFAWHGVRRWFGAASRAIPAGLVCVLNIRLVRGGDLW